MSTWFTIGQTIDGWTIYRHHLAYDNSGRNIVENVYPVVTEIRHRWRAIDAANELAQIERK